MDKQIRHVFLSTKMCWRGIERRNKTVKANMMMIRKKTSVDDSFVKNKFYFLFFDILTMKRILLRIYVFLSLELFFTSENWLLTQLIGNLTKKIVIP